MKTILFKMDRWANSISFFEESPIFAKKSLKAEATFEVISLQSTSNQESNFHLCADQ